MHIVRLPMPFRIADRLRAFPAALLPRLLSAVSSKYAVTKPVPAAEPTDEDRDELNRRAESILTRYGNNILRLAYSYLHNTADAEEVVQDTLVQFLRTAPVFSDKSHEEGWLMRVAGNLSKNRIRYNRIRTTDELNDELAAEER